MSSANGGSQTPSNLSKQLYAHGDEVIINYLNGAKDVAGIVLHYSRHSQNYSIMVSGTIYAVHRDGVTLKNDISTPAHPKQLNFDNSSKKCYGNETVYSIAKRKGVLQKDLDAETVIFDDLNENDDLSDIDENQNEPQSIAKISMELEDSEIENNKNNDNINKSNDSKSKKRIQKDNIKKKVIDDNDSQTPFRSRSKNRTNNVKEVKNSKEQRRSSSREKKRTFVPEPEIKAKEMEKKVVYNLSDRVCIPSAKGSNRYEPAYISEIIEDGAEYVCQKDRVKGTFTCKKSQIKPYSYLLERHVKFMFIMDKQFPVAITHKDGNYDGDMYTVTYADGGKRNDVHITMLRYATDDELNDPLIKIKAHEQYKINSSYKIKRTHGKEVVKLLEIHKDAKQARVERQNGKEDIIDIIDLTHEVEIKVKSNKMKRKNESVTPSSPDNERKESKRLRVDDPIKDYSSQEKVNTKSQDIQSVIISNNPVIPLPNAKIVVKATDKIFSPVSSFKLIQKDISDKDSDVDSNQENENENDEEIKAERDEGLEMKELSLNAIRKRKESNKNITERGENESETEDENGGYESDKKGGIDNKYNADTEVETEVDNASDNDDKGEEDVEMNNTIDKDGREKDEKEEDDDETQFNENKKLLDELKNNSKESESDRIDGEDQTEEKVEERQQEYAEEADYYCGNDSGMGDGYDTEEENKKCEICLKSFPNLDEHCQASTKCRSALKTKKKLDDFDKLPLFSQPDLSESEADEAHSKKRPSLKSTHSSNNNNENNDVTSTTSISRRKTRQSILKEGGNEKKKDEFPPPKAKVISTYKVGDYVSTKYGSEFVNARIYFVSNNGSYSVKFEDGDVGDASANDIRPGSMNKAIDIEKERVRNKTKEKIIDKKDKKGKRKSHEKIVKINDAETEDEKSDDEESEFSKRSNRKPYKVPLKNTASKNDRQTSFNDVVEGDTVLASSVDDDYLWCATVISKYETGAKVRYMFDNTESDIITWKNIHLVKDYLFAGNMVDYDAIFEMEKGVPRWETCKIVNDWSINKRTSIVIKKLDKRKEINLGAIRINIISVHAQSTTKNIEKGDLVLANSESDNFWWCATVESVVDNGAKVKYMYDETENELVTLNQIHSIKESFIAGRIVEYDTEIGDKPWEICKIVKGWDAEQEKLKVRRKNDQVEGIDLSKIRMSRPNLKVNPASIPSMLRGTQQTRRSQRSRNNLEDIGEGPFIDGELRRGRRVKCKLWNLEFLAVIKEVNVNGSYNITFDDGTEENNVESGRLSKAQEPLYNKNWIKKRDILQHEIGDENDENIKRDGESCFICKESYDEVMDGEDYIRECRLCSAKVHRDCYGGDPQLFNKEWVCDLCYNIPDKKARQKVKCALCPCKTNGAMKAFRAEIYGWAHINCALLVANIYFGNAETREKIEGFENVEPWRKEYRCIVCHDREGVVIDCNSKGCTQKFHAGCAIDSGFSAEMDENAVKYYCPKHREVLPQDAPCHECHENNDENSMLLCDDCSKPYHMHCLNPPLTEIPEELWFCPRCIKRKLILGTIIQVPAQSNEDNSASQMDRRAAVRSIYVPLTKEYVASLPKATALMTDDEAESGESEDSEEEEEDDEGKDDDEGSTTTSRKKEKSVPKRPDHTYKENKKTKGKNSPYASLNLPDIAQANEIVANLPPKHAAQRLALQMEHENQFQNWAMRLAAGFNLLFYGFGSKRAVVIDLLRAKFEGQNVLLINGYGSSINMKATCLLILKKIFHSDKTFNNTLDSCRYIAELSNANNAPTLYIVIQNIDGERMRVQETQIGLSILAAAKSIRMLATIDHINAHILWDGSMMNRFCWSSVDVTTFEPYTEELKHFNTKTTVYNQDGGKGIKYILSSLTTNHKNVLRLLAQQHLDDESEGSGMDFFTLYDKCRDEGFFVSSDSGLKSVLNELKDHQIVAVKRNSDNKEYLYLSIDDDQIQTLL